MEVLKTSYQIKRALGDVYRYLVNRYDIKAKERRATGNIGKRLRPNRCAACGRKTSSTYRLEAAHITPLAECSKTKEVNLLLLCRERHPKRGKGCHTLYDQGFCSVVEIVECREEWLSNRTAKLRKKIDILVTRFGEQPQQQGFFKKQLRYLCEEQKRFPLKSPESHSFQVQIAELTRRRPYNGALEDAEEEILKVHPQYLQSDTLLSRYYYEKAYIELLSGRIVDAFRDFLKGRKILESNLHAPGNRWRWAAHTSLLAQVTCIMRLQDKRVRWTWSQIHSELSKAVKYSKEAAKEASRTNLQDELRHSSRWVQNCLIHLVKPEIALRNLKAARRQWNIAYKNWLRMDVSSGWDAGFRPTILWLYGKLLFEENKIEEATAYLVRALVLLLGHRRQQPEGIRDLLFTLADALEKKGDKVHSYIRYFASWCYEFSSWFNPYVPVRTEK